MNRLLTELAYVVVRGPVREWQGFGTEVLGAQLVDHDDPSCVVLRTDERAYRLIIREGEAGDDALDALGFSTESDKALDLLIDTLTAADVPVVEDPQLASYRQVRRMAVFSDHDGHRIEAHVGHETATQPFVSSRGVEFVCGALGVGHAFFVTADGERSAAFYRDLLGFGMTDTISFGPENGYFLHCNPRHHSIAFAALPTPSRGLNHLMLEVSSLEDVGRALDVVQERGDHVMLSIGEHSNDRMVSFYVVTPSGFAVEYGWNGRTVDPLEWAPSHYDSSSIWGHHFARR